MYKMIVLDLDGTLLTSAHTISLKTKAALLNAQKKGIKVVLASGRPTYGMLPYAKELGLEEYLITFNGACIYDITKDQHVFEQGLTSTQIQELAVLAQKEDLNILTFDRQTVVCSNIDEYNTYESTLNNLAIEARDFSQITFTAPKCIMTTEPSKLKHKETKFKHDLDEYQISLSQPMFLEFTAKGIDKASTITRLCEMLDITTDEVIAFGDGGNDLSMIKLAGMGVAMGNAVDDVKKEANYVTLDNDHDGIAAALNELLDI